MHVVLSLRYAAGAAAAAALLGGCSANGSPPVPAAGGPAVIPSAVSDSHAAPRARRASAVTATLVYVSDFDSNTVNVFSAGGTLERQIQNLGGPQGLFVDSQHDLWVANTSRSNILEFAPGASAPEATLNDPAGRPSDVTICPNGTTYVSSFSNSEDTGSILVYAPGHADPTGSLATPGENNFYLTCDAHGNVFSTFVQGASGPGGVVEYAGGVQAGHKVLPIKLSIAPGGIKPDSAGNLLVCDQDAHTITEYTQAGASTGKSINTGKGFINDIAVTADGRFVGGANDTRQIGIAFSFPSGAVAQKYVGVMFRPTGFAFD